MTAVLAVIGAAALSAQEYFTSTGTAQGATNSYVIIPKRTGIACVFFVDATIYNTDVTNSVPLVWYAADPPRTITRAGINGTNTIYLSATNGLVIGDVLVVGRNKDTTFERHTLLSLTSSNITITGTLGGATVAGDTVYRMAVGGRVRYQDTVMTSGLIPRSLRIGPANQHIFSGLDGRPSLIEMQGTLTNVLNTVAGRWLPPSLGK